MCRIPLPLYEQQPDFDYYDEDPLDGMAKQDIPFDGSLSDVGFESDLDMFGSDASPYQILGQEVKEEDAVPYLGSVQPLPLDVQGRSWSSNVQQGDDFLSLAKEPPVVTLPVVGGAGACLPPKPVQKVSPLPGSELPSAGQDLEAAQFLRMLDQAAGGSAAGLTPWGWTENSKRAGNQVVGSQPTPQQLQSKRLQQAMVMRGGSGAMPGHGRKSREEVAAQVERVKKRRRESAQRSRQRKNEYMKTLEDENRMLKYELAKLRQWVTRMSKDGAPLATSPAQSFSHGSNTNL